MGDAAIIDQLSIPKRLDLPLQPGRRKAGKFRNRLHVDIERIEKEAAVRRIGRRVVIEQRMQRIEADAGGAEFASKVDQAGEIGEIAVAPIAPRAHAIELHCQRP